MYLLPLLPAGRNISRAFERKFNAKVKRSNTLLLGKITLRTYRIVYPSRKGLGVEIRTIGRQVLQLVRIATQLTIKSKALSHIKLVFTSEEFILEAEQHHDCHRLLHHISGYLCRKPALQKLGIVKT